MTTMPPHLRDTIYSVDLSDLRASRHREDVNGFGQVEYQCMEYANQDEHEGWSIAIDALEIACEAELGVRNCRYWRQVGRDGRWVRFQAT